MVGLQVTAADEAEEVEPLITFRLAATISLPCSICSIGWRWQTGVTDRGLVKPAYLPFWLDGAVEDWVF